MNRQCSGQTRVALKSRSVGGELFQVLDSTFGHIRFLLMPNQCDCIGFIVTKKSPNGEISFDCNANTDDQEVKCTDLNVWMHRKNVFAKTEGENAAKGWLLCGVVWPGHYDTRDQNCQHFVNAVLKKCTGDCLPDSDYGAPPWDYEDCVGKQQVHGDRFLWK